MEQNQLINILKLAWPVLVIQISLQVYSIIDVSKKKKTKNLIPLAWIIIILVGGIIGPSLYLLIGRAEE
jgi:hypothetical protein